MPLIGALGLTLLAYAGLLATWAAGAAVLRRPRGAAHSVGLAVLELGLVLQAAGRGYGLVTGTSVPADPAMHAGYLVASITLLPLLLGLARPGAAAPTRAERAWQSAVVAVACVAVMVVEVRLIATGTAGNS